MDQSKRKLKFIGRIRANTGKFHREMVVPGRHSLLVVPDDWPVKLAPGTLNVDIDADGYPGNFNEIGVGDRVKKLDEGAFKPAFILAQAAIRGNTLKPTSDMPLRGTGQVWRAELSVLSTGATVTCWVLRRIGSGIASQIELVAEFNLREHLNLKNDTSVTVLVVEG